MDEDLISVQKNNYNCSPGPLEIFEHVMRNFRIFFKVIFIPLQNWVVDVQFGFLHLFGDGVDSVSNGKVHVHGRPAIHFVVVYGDGIIGIWCSVPHDGLRKRLVRAQRTIKIQILIP